MFLSTYLAINSSNQHLSVPEERHFGSISIDRMNVSPHRGDLFNAPRWGFAHTHHQSTTTKITPLQGFLSALNLFIELR